MPGKRNAAMVLAVVRGRVAADGGGYTAKPPTDETVTVRHIADGGTAILQDCRVIRFVVSDTPEFNKHSKLPAEFVADAARRGRQNKIPIGSRVKLVFGVERRDDYAICGKQIGCSFEVVFAPTAVVDNDCG